MKRKIAFLVAFSMLISLLTLTAHGVRVDTREYTKSILETASADSQVSIDPVDSQTILSQFAPEVRYVENKYNVQITEINDGNLELLKHEAILNLENSDYRFSQLMDEIALACAESRWNNAVAANNAMPLADSKVTITVEHEFDALSGEHLENVAPGMTKTVEKGGNIGVNISAGTKIYGITIEANLFKSVGYSCQGPADGATLNNGQEATHRTAFGVMYGTIMKHVVEYVTGNVYTFYYVDQSTMDTQAYTRLTVIGVPSYADTYRDTSLHFENYNTLYSEIKKNPKRFLPA